MKKRFVGNVLFPLILCVVLALTAVMPLGVAAVMAAEKPETVRVGFFALEGYHEMAADGTLSGYDHDFLHLTEKYVNLNFEYVGYDKSWEETLQMLSDGEIDMVTSAFKTEERMELYDFSMPIGTCSIDLSTRMSETRFVAEDYSTYDGMTVGMISGRSVSDMLAEFAEENGFSYTAKYYDDSSSLKAALQSGEVDAVATISLREIEDEQILSEFGARDFYCMVRKGDTELLDKINYAITQLNTSEGDWKNTFYYDNYMADDYTDLTFTEEEQAFIEQYSTGGKSIVIATDNKWAPFSWKEDGTYQGILPEYIEMCMEMCGMNYTFYDYDDDVFPVTSESMEQVDLYICYGLPDNDDDAGLLASSTFIENGAAYLQRRGTGTIRTVAIAASTPNLNTRLDVADDVTVVEYPDTDAAKQAVEDGEVDAAFVYGYDAEYTVNKDSTGKLAFTESTVEPFGIMAVMASDKDHTLMSILMKCINHMPSSQKSAILSKYVSFSATDMNLWDYIELYPVAAMAAVAVLLILISVIGFFLFKNRSEKRYAENLEEKVDEITELNSQLQSKQDSLEEASIELEAQMAEIGSLNEEQEAQLEEIRQLNEEQEAQLEEIRALNDELENNQDKLVKACRQADSANQAKTSFLFNMSHDIRTPMNAIIGFADLLEKHQEEPEKRADYLKKIQDSSAVLLSIINNVLEMARIEKGTVVIDEVPWDAKEFNDSLYEVFADMMEKKHQTFIREVHVEHQYVCCDPIKLREVFINILSNAYKYTEEGGTITMTVDEIPSNREGYAMYRTVIADTGMGMAEDFLPHLFEEFSRENNTTDNKIEGTGLGMPIVKRLIDLMEGTVEVKSQKGVGTTFIVTLPHKIAQKDDTADTADMELDMDIFKGKRILLAEDNDLNAEIAIELLTEAGFEMYRAEDGQVCIDMLKQASDFFYDVILMDVQMPNLNGYEATKVIRELPDPAKANIPIIAMTANAFEEDKRDALNAGMDGHLAKPVDEQELCKTLMGIFNREKS